MMESAERGTIDDVTMPHATRPRIARALAMRGGRRWKCWGGFADVKERLKQFEGVGRPSLTEFRFLHRRQHVPSADIEDCCL